MNKAQRIWDEIGRCPVVPMLLALMCVAGYPSKANGQILQPLRMAAAEPILNEHGEVIEGHARQDPAERPLVHILYVGEGREPPDEWTGAPHIQNDLFLETHIGSLVASSLTHSGLFGATIPDRRSALNQDIFVRVYNRPTTGESLFYAESTNALTVTDSEEPLMVYMGPMTNIIHHRSTANDGIPDWWKVKAGLDPTELVDLDAPRPGFNMTLREALIAGADPMDPLARFVVTSVEPLYSTTHFWEYVWEDDDPDSPTYGLLFTQRIYDVIGDIVAWPSVEGRKYALEYATNLLLSDFQPVPKATNLAAMPPRNIFTNIPVLGEDLPERVFYRARVRWPDMPDLEDLELWDE